MPAVYRLGLDERLLRIAELYLGEPCFYMGISAKRERVSPRQAGTRQWHMDIEDDRMLRFLIYLSDVDEAAGPFNYVPSACQRTATGGFGTLLACDGTRIFHRAGWPTGRKRLSLSMTYSSRHPRQIMRPVRLRWPSRNRLLETLTERIPPARWA